jgi:hypothetical protein
MVKKLAKKAQDGDYMSSDGKSYTYTKKVKRPEGDRYYTGKSGDSNIAMRMANFKSRAKPADSTVTADVEQGALKKLNQKKNGGWIQKATASIKRRGTAGKCTPITKPGCTGKAKTLAKTFKKMAAKRKSK